MFYRSAGTANQTYVRSLLYVRIRHNFRIYSFMFMFYVDYIINYRNAMHFLIEAELHPQTHDELLYILRRNASTSCSSK